MRGNVLYNGKCYLWYVTTPNVSHDVAKFNCGAITSVGCVASAAGVCTTSGFGRLATFETWTDYQAVTSAMNSTGFQPTTIGMGCSKPANTIVSDDPPGQCIPHPLNMPSEWPMVTGSCTNDTCVFINSAWTDLQAQPCTQLLNGYMCEAGKIVKKHRFATSEVR